MPPPPSPSITFWNRLEPRPRSPAIASSLAARVRDPLWMLTRQWQMGEFQGEDAGSPSFLEIDLRVARLERMRFQETDAFVKLDPAVPLERIVEAEPFSPDLSVRVELGQTFEVLLEDEGAAEALGFFRTAHPLNGTPDPRDAEARRFLEVCAGRATDGVDVYQAAKAGTLKLPPDAALAAKAAAAAARLVRWAEEVFGVIGNVDAPAWDSLKLEYRLQVAGPNLDGGTIVLSGHPGRDGDLDWYAFDLEPIGMPDSGRVEQRAFASFPTHVRFRGMPSPRWWDFELGTTDFGAVEPQRRDLGKMMVMDFMLVHGVDWFIVPVPLELGSICWVKDLAVHDVFGNVTHVTRADAGSVASPLERWSLYSTALSSGGAAVAPFFLLPPSPASAVQTGPTLEEVRFFRDETAEMVWAVERTTENGIGAPWNGQERDLAGRPPAPAPAESGAPLRYRIETEVPEHWIPFLPVLLDATSGEISLQRATILRPTDHGDVPVLPIGRILRPAAPSYFVAEEEVPRVGTWVTRTANRTRWIDGSTHLWSARHRGVGGGEGSSALRYDAVEREAPVAPPRPP